MYDEYGFFRNLYLWSTTTSVAPIDLWGIVDIIEKLQWLSDIDSPKHRMIEHSVPFALALYFPKSVLQHVEGKSSGLINLREVSRDSHRVGIPQRSIHPLEA
jgi:anaerobic magnesium-protoporphyrin IX monomethyl ester cyclase